MYLLLLKFPHNLAFSPSLETTYIEEQSRHWCEPLNMNHADGVREMAFSRAHKEKPILGKIGEAEKLGGRGCGLVLVPQGSPSLASPPSKGFE